MSAATAHRCSLNVTPQCIGSDVKPGKGPRKCPGCGGSLILFTGRWGVFRWRGDGQYRADDAVKASTVKRAAEAYALANGADLVVRWITESIAA